MGVSAKSSNPSFPASKTPSTMDVETRRCPFTIPPTQRPAYEKCSICSRAISVCCLYWHEGWMLPSSMRFQPFPRIPKLVMVSPRFPTDVNLSYSSDAVWILLMLLPCAVKRETSMQMKNRNRIYLIKTAFWIWELWPSDSLIKYIPLGWCCAFHWNS